MLLAPYLHMDRVTVENIDLDYNREELKKYNFLCKWSETMGSDATYEVLVGGILKLGNAYVALCVCKLLSDQVSTA